MIFKWCCLCQNYSVSYTSMGVWSVQSTVQPRVYIYISWEIQFNSVTNAFNHPPIDIYVPLKSSNLWDTDYLCLIMSRIWRLRGFRSRVGDKSAVHDVDKSPNISVLPHHKYLQTIIAELPYLTFLCWKTNAWALTITIRRYKHDSCTTHWFVFPVLEENIIAKVILKVAAASLLPISWIFCLSMVTPLWRLFDRKKRQTKSRRPTTTHRRASLISQSLRILPRREPLTRLLSPIHHLKP